MAHSTYYFIFLLLFFSLVHHVSYIKEELLIRKLSFSHRLKSPFFASNFKVNVKSLTEKYSFLHENKQKTKDAPETEISLKLKKYNLRLNRQLKTLTYISMMEDKYQTNGKTQQSKELFDLKGNIQREVMKITQKIQYLKSIKNNTALGLTA